MLKQPSTKTQICLNLYHPALFVSQDIQNVYHPSNTHFSQIPLSAPKKTILRKFLFVKISKLQGKSTWLTSDLP